MFLLVKLAWRNLFRNTRRTVLSGLAVGLGLAALIFYDALVIGMTNTMIETATATLPGQAQIHHAGFRTTLDVANVIADPAAVLAGLAQEPEVKAYAPRVASYAMLSSAADVASVMLYGVDPERERTVSRLAVALKQGRYLNADEPETIYLGERLARNLAVGLGDRVVVTVAQAGTGELSQAMFRVGGIFALGGREMDGGLAFVTLAQAQQLLRLNGSLHEIAVTFKHLSAAEDASSPFWSRYSQAGNEAVSWSRLFPELKTILNSTQYAVVITAFILFGIVSFGIMNTLFMSLYERMFEFGVIRAIGTRPYQVALIMALEAACLAVISIAIGVALGWGATAFAAAVGIDYRGIEVSGVTLRDLIRPVIRPEQYSRYPLWLFGFTVLVGLYPALYAARMSPAKAMKRSL
jgi:ABC-type lipoprotein release transport system permease subunit